jgi:hypothetical protein
VTFSPTAQAKYIKPDLPLNVLETLRLLIHAKRTADMLLLKMLCFLMLPEYDDFK